MFPRGTPNQDRLSRCGGGPTGAHRHSVQGRGTKGPTQPDRLDRPRAAVPASVQHFLPSAVDQQAHPSNGNLRVQRG